MKLCLYIVVLLMALVGAHVPHFDTACATVSDPDISQAFYFKTPPGGHDVVFVNPKDVKDGEVFLQLTLTEPRDLPRVEAFVGCLTNERDQLCRGESRDIDGAAQISSPTISKTSIEPFTQTVYHTLAEKTLFNATTPCTGFYGIMLRVRHSETDCQVYDSVGCKVRWSAVVGKREAFSIWELLSFPIYIAYLHGSYGNGFYRFHILSLLALLSIAVHLSKLRKVDPSERIYVLAGAVFTLVSVDILLHYVDACNRVREIGSFGLFLMNFIFSNGLPLLLLSSILLSNNPQGRHLSGGLTCLCVLYSTMLGILGDTSMRITLIGLWSIVTILAFFMRVYNGGIFALLLTTFSLLIVPSVGSGYWLGPLLLFFKGIHSCWTVVTEGNREHANAYGPSCETTMRL